MRAVATVGGESRSLPADVLVWNAGRRVQDDLYRLGRHQVEMPMHVIGDAVSPRRIGHAILEGYRAGATS